MDADRRDYTNQHGYQVPTENAALNSIAEYEKALATARKLYGIFVRSCSLCGFVLTDVGLERNGIKFVTEDFNNGTK